MLANSVLKSLGCAANVPMVTVSRVFTYDNASLKEDRYSCGQQVERI